MECNKHNMKTVSSSSLRELHSMKRKERTRINGAIKHLTRGCTTLMYACQQGHTGTIVKELRTKPEAILLRDRSRKSVLHYCSGQRDLVAAASVAVAAPELLESADEDGFTPLHLAVIQGNIAMVNLLLANKADVNALDNEGHSVVHWATVCGEVEALRAVLSAGASVATPDVNGGSPLHYAAQMCGSNYEGKLGKTSTKLALDILDILIAHPNSSVDVVDKDGRQPLLWAASAGSAKAIISLVKAGARVESSDKDGLTALHCAASRGHTECIDTLIGLCGAPTDLIDSNGCTALHYAVTLGHADATARLLELEADSNRQDRKGRTPAHCGCAKGQFETVKLLKEKGANLWLRNAKGDLPVHEAAASGRRELVEWLLEQRPKQVNTTCNDGRTMLHIAASNDYTDMCKMLLDYGADINCIYRSMRGQVFTPLDCALQKGHRSTAKFLQANGGLPSSKLHLSARRPNAFSEQELVKPLKYEKKDVQELKTGKKYIIYVRQSDSECSCSEYVMHKHQKHPHVCREHRKRTRRRTSSCGEAEDATKDGSCSDISRSKSNLEIRRKCSKDRSCSSNSENEDSCENCCRHKRKFKRIRKRGKYSRRSKEYLVSPRDYYCKDELELSRSKENLYKVERPEIIVQKPIPMPLDNYQPDDSPEQEMKEVDANKSIEPDAMSNTGEVEVTTILTEAEVHAPAETVSSVETVIAAESLIAATKTEAISTSPSIKHDLVEEINAVLNDATSAVEVCKMPTTEVPPETVINLSDEKQEADAVPSDKAQKSEEISPTQQEIVEAAEELQRKFEGSALEQAQEKPNSQEECSDKLPEGEAGSVMPPEIVIATDEQLQEIGSGKDEPISASPSPHPSPSPTPETSTMIGSQDFVSTEVDSKIIQEVAEQKQTTVESNETKEDTLKKSSQQEAFNVTVEPTNDASKDMPKEISQTDANKDPEPDQDREPRRSFTILSSHSEEEKAQRKSSFTVLKSDESIDVEEVAAEFVEEKKPSFQFVDDGRPKAHSDNEYTTDDGADLADAVTIPAHIRRAADSTARFTKHSSDAPFQELGSRKRRLKKRIRASDKPRAWSSMGAPIYQGSKDQDSGFEPSPRALKTKIPTPRIIHTAIPPRRPIYATLDHRSCSSRAENRKLGDKNACNMTAVTKSIQKNMRRYYMERKIFQHLLELKSLQIRSSKLNEAVLVKRAVDDYHKSCMALGAEMGGTLRRYPYTEYTFKNFEMFLYETLKSLQKSGSNNFQNIEEVYQEAERRLSPDYGIYEKALRCTTKTHRCFHAAHAYTGIPCAAYIPFINHHTIPKMGFGPYKKTGIGSFYLPKILTGHSKSGSKVSLELSHGKNKQLIPLPSEKLDSNKRYYVTFTVKGSEAGEKGCRQSTENEATDAK